MKFLVLMWAIFQIFSFTSSDTNSTTESFTLINSANLAKQGCNSTCGDLVIPYPFGIGDNPKCYIDEGFRIYCNTSLNPPKATIYEGGNNSIKLISDSTIRLSNLLASRCYSPNGSIDKSPIIMRFDARPYSLSKVNKFTVIGCDSSALLRSIRWPARVSTGCTVNCYMPDDVVAGECTGNGCCQSSIPQDITYYGTSVRNSGDDMNFKRSVPCTYAFVGEENVFNFSGVTDLVDTSFKKRIEETVPIVLDWAIGHLSCSEAKATKGFACQSNSICVSFTSKRGGYRCECKESYEGNPYLSPGCQDINECDRMEDFPCYGTCINTPGNYTCKCKEGYYGDGNIQNGCRRNPFNVLGLSIGMGIGFLALLTGLLVLYFMAKKRKIAKLREKFYEQNGGALLEEKLKNTGGIGVGFMKVFRFEELKEATDNYAEDRILGRGAKIADFGASRLVPLGHDQVTTLVQGTFGYLDPEYFHTGQLTDKSDVYSFGVVLAELITGQRPLNMERCLEDRNLATYFVKAKKEDRLHELLDRQMIEEATDEQLKAACDLVYKCLNLVGGNRPSMKEVSMELESLRKHDKHPWIHQESYNETRNLMGECEETDLFTVPLVEYGSSSIGTEGIMLQVQNPR